MKLTRTKKLLQDWNSCLMDVLSGCNSCLIDMIFESISHKHVGKFYNFLK